MYASRLSIYFLGSLAKSGRNNHGRYRVITGISICEIADSNRRLPIKHQGQLASETTSTSMYSFGGVLISDIDICCRCINIAVVPWYIARVAPIRYW